MAAQTIESVKRVALLCGGISGEREISLASGEGAKNALVEAGYDVDVFDPARKEDLKALIDGDYDVAFLTTHGHGGEDGKLQGFLETIGLPYIGPGVFSSALAMDKGKAKLFYERVGLDTPPGFVISARTANNGRENTRPSTAEIIERLGEQCVVKPATEGSTLGVFLTEGAAAIEEAIEAALAMSPTVLVERHIHGTELTVAVIGNDELEALPVIEIIPKNEFYDFESKYAPGGCQHICPARIDDELTKRVQEQAILAHQALSCEGVSRSDFILDEEGTTWILETNTLPGMTATSLLPDAARVAGISFPELCRRLIAFAVNREV